MSIRSPARRAPAPTSFTRDAWFDLPELARQRRRLRRQRLWIISIAVVAAALLCAGVLAL